MRTLYLIYFWLICLPIFATLTLIASIVCVIGCLLGGRRVFAYWPGMIWSRIALLMTGCRVTVHGKERIRQGQNYVVMANHQSAFDIFVMYGYLGIPFRWVLKSGIRKIPMVGQACQASGFIFVDENKPSSISRTMQDAKQVLAEQTSIFIFPEGSRTADGRMARFRKGGILMADELSVPVLPVSIDGSFDVLRIGHFVPYPQHIQLTIHPSVYVHEFGTPPRSYLSAIAEIRMRIASVLPNEQNA